MAQSAAHLVDCVIPRVPVRDNVVALPTARAASVAEQTFGDRQQLPADRRQLDAPPAPMKQLHAKVILQRGNMRGDRGLANVQQLGSGREAARSGNGVESGEQALVH